MYHKSLTYPLIINTEANCKKNLQMVNYLHVCYLSWCVTLSIILSLQFKQLLLH